MYYTGFADEAAHGLTGQIAATRELGWSRIESRKIDGINIHDLSDAAFDQVERQLQAAGITVSCFGSAIANWGKSIEGPDTPSLEEAKRAIPRMKRLGTTFIRIMSYAVLPGRGAEQQLAEERFRRLRDLTRMFQDHGLQCLHENCNNYGGMGWQYTLRMLEAVPGLRLVFDTGNPLQDDDFSKPKDASGRYPKQSSWEFYQQVKAHIAYVHIKDARFDLAAGATIHTFPGEGDGEVRRIVADLLANGYDGGFSIEPHLAVVHHDPGITAPEAIMRANYVEYGRRFMAMVTQLQTERAAPRRGQGAARTA
jgi:sugar phosphate isomerase/epimerase